MEAKTATAPKAIYLFFGEDTWSSHQKSRHWREAFEKKYGDINIHLLEGQTLTSQEFSAATESVPFLSEKKLLIIENFLEDGKEDDQKNVAETIESLADYCIIVFIENKKPDARTALYKKIKKNGQLEEFELLVGPQLIEWIMKEAQKQQAIIGTSEARLLAETVGPNLWQMEQELKKLTLYCGKEPISSDAIAKITNPNPHSSIFKLTDYMGQKRAKEALKTFHVLLESGEEIMGIFFMMVRQFRILIQLRDGLEQKLSQSEITAKMKIHPYVIMNSMNQAKNFSNTLLTTIYRKLLQIDSDIKSGKIKIATGNTLELQLAMEKFLIELCQ